METKEKTYVKRVDNNAYRERFQFIVRVNDNIICQRYFKINHFEHDSLNSKELFEALDGYHGEGQEMKQYFERKSMGVVQLIQRDLESKSRIYTWATNECTCKLTGFAKDENGEPINGLSYAGWEPKPFDETEIVQPWEVTFSFEFLVDDKIVYQRIWDGSQYPKYVRNTVDLTNSKSQYPMVQLMNQGKSDLVVEIISQICAACSSNLDEKKTYTKSERYTNDEMFIKATGNESIVADGNKYAYSAYNREYVNSWREAVLKKYGPSGLNSAK